MRITLLLIALSGILLSCNKGKKNTKSCNGSSTRRDVKICIDDATTQIDLTPTTIDVASIGALEVPEIDKDDPRQDAEKKVYTITATVHKLSKHRDGDWKVKLTDGNDKYINCENPNPGCEYAKDSDFYDAFLNVREWIEANKNDLVGKTVTITGVGFIDIDHKYPRNAADNEMELHPILSIHY
ncbi:MAG: hypothetical protein DCO96_02395 [Fluviicola sp. XM-24bin1]|nr:MAG: hypothetical protein DCO96_02395 [Fluviicola sp. XM-24bin1]